MKAIDKKKRKTKKPWNGKRRISELHGAELIKRAAEIFKRHNIRFWLDFGTLLGKTRDGKFISHDGDIDLGVDYTQWNPDVVNDLCENGFVIRKATNRLTNKNFIKFVGEDKMDSVTHLKLGYRYKYGEDKIAGIKVCVEIYHAGVGEYKNMLYFWPSTKPNYLVEIPRDYVIPQIKDTFYNTEIYIPKNYEVNLEYMYGENWRIVNPNYKSSEEHKKSSERFRRYFE